LDRVRGASSHRSGRLNGKTTKLRFGRGLGLRRLLIDNFPHNNQPKIGVREAGEYEGEVRRAGGEGEVQYHCFGGVGS